MSDEWPEPTEDELALARMYMDWATLRRAVEHLNRISIEAVLGSSVIDREALGVAHVLVETARRHLDALSEIVPEHDVDAPPVMSAQALAGSLVDLVVGRAGVTLAEAAERSSLPIEELDLLRRGLVDPPLSELVRVVGCLGSELRLSVVRAR